MHVGAMSDRLIRGILMNALFIAKNANLRLVGLLRARGSSQRPLMLVFEFQAAAFLDSLCRSSTEYPEIEQQEDNHCRRRN